MNERRQDLMVGLFVVIGMVALGVLVVLFGEAPHWLTGKRYAIRISFTTLSDVQEGTEVTMNGISVGRVSTIEFKDSKYPEHGTYVYVQVDPQYQIPLASTARVRPAAIGFGRSDILIEVPAETTGFVPQDGSAIIAGRMGSPLDAFFPQSVIATFEKTAGQIGDLAEELTPVAADLHEIMQLRTIEAVDRAKAEGGTLPPNLYTSIERLYHVLTHVDQVLGDPEVQSNLRVTIDNLRKATEEAVVAMRDVREFTQRGGAIGDKLEKTLDTAQASIDTVTRKLARNLDQLSDVLEQLDKASRTVAVGDGTIGKILRDPKLYDEMVETVKRLQVAIDDLRGLIQQLREKGILSKE